MTPTRLARSFCVFALALQLSPAATARQEQATALDRAALEAGFERSLSGCRLVGFFTDDHAPEGQPPQTDSYAIRQVTKLPDGRWQFDAIVPFGDNELVVPLPLQVEWAGDTPVITLTDLAVPEMGTFTARVLFHRGQYAGTWSSPDHGGHMYGQIVSDEPAGAAASGGEQSAADDLGEDSPHWPAFRGHRARGFAEGYASATTWDLEAGENVLWKTAVPGLAHSSPIVWGDRLFVTTAVKQEGGDTELKVGLYGDIGSVANEGVHQFQLLCLDKNDGRLLWSRTAHEGVPAVKRHPKSSHAASTPATDGEHVVAFFASEGLYCYDIHGELLWQKDFGVLDSGFFMVPEAQWGFASSPILHGGRVIVQVDVQEDSFLAAFDADTGEQVWRTPRSDVPTWSSPTVDVRADRSQVIVNGYKHIGGYDLGTGAELWKLEGGGDIPVPTPVVAHDLIFITNAHGRMAPIYAISVGASGELAGTAEDEQQMAWSTPRRGNYMQTPLVYGEYLYCCNDAGILTCYEADTGVVRYQQRLGSGGSGFSASAVATDGKLYLTSEEGEVHVVGAGPEFESLAVNEMGETCMATPAISQGVLFWRTRGHVVAVTER